MSNQPAAALPTRISTLDDRFIGRKLRLAGRLLSIDYDTQYLLLLDHSNHACLVNAALCIDPLHRIPELFDSKTVITVVGYLEKSKTALSIPTLPAFVDAPELNEYIYLDAILLIPTPHLDLKLWNEGICAREDAGLHQVHTDFT